MTCDAALLIDRWETVDIRPGGFVILVTQDEELALAARISGLQLKDTLLILGPGRRSSFGFLFRAPMVGTLVENIRANGNGAMNINACRTKADLSEFFSATGKPRSGMGHAHGYGMGDGYGGDKANPPNKGGRWPTNMVLIHSGGCQVIGTRSVTTGVAHRTNGGGKTFGGNVDKPAMADMTYGDGGKETIPAYECEKDCSVRLLDEQSGDRPSTLTGHASPDVAHAHPSSATTESWYSGGQAEKSQVYADGGGASRFYPQFKNAHDFYSWAVRLITHAKSEIRLVS